MATLQRRRSWPGRLALLLFGAGGLWGNPDVKAAEPTPCFYAPWDGSVDPAMTAGSKVLPEKADWKFAPGRFGPGLLVAEDGAAPSALYRAEANVRPEAGTLCFWLQPAWSDDDPTVPEEYRHFLNVGHSGGSAFMFYWQKSNRAVYFATGGTDPADGVWKWNYTPAERSPFLKKGQWVHLALTWDRARKRKAIYVDGSLLAQAEDGLGVLCAPGDFHQLLLCVGAAYRTNNLAPGVYDELIVYPQALEEEDIRRLAQQTQPLAVPTSLSLPQPPLRIDLGLPDPPEGVVAAGEPFCCQVPIQNLSDREFAGDLEYHLSDYYAERDEVVHHLRLAPGESFQDEVRFTRDDFGPFKIHVQYRGPERSGLPLPIDVWHRDVITFGVVPKDLIERGPKPNSFFGHHPHIFGVKSNLEACQRIGVKWVRCLDMIQSTWWLYVEPEPGKFEFRLEEDVNLAIDRGMNVLGTFFWTPRWAADVPDDWPADNIFYRCYPPQDWELFRRYVRRTVRHYKDRIHTWEAWNEPYQTGCWRGTPEQYVKLLQIVYETCKEEDPTCQVLGMGGTGHSVRAWNEQVLAAGAMKYMDLFDVHPEFGVDLRPERAQAQVEDFYALMDRYGGRKPIWHTESGLTSTTFYADLDFPELPPPENRTPPPNYPEAANTLVRTYCSWMSRGVQKHFFYYMRAMKDSPDRAYVDYGMADVTGTPKPDGFAYAAMAWLLEDLQWKTEWQRTERDSRFVSFDWRTSKVGEAQLPPDLLLRGHLFEGHGRAIAVLWAEPGADIVLNLPSTSCELRDLMGNPFYDSQAPPPPFRVRVGEAPCYLLLPGLTQPGPPATAADLATLLQQGTMEVLRPMRRW